MSSLLINNPEFLKLLRQLGMPEGCSRFEMLCTPGDHVQVKATVALKASGNEAFTNDLKFRLVPEDEYERLKANADKCHFDEWGNCTVHGGRIMMPDDLGSTRPVRCDQKKEGP